MELLEIVDDYYAEFKKKWCGSSHWKVWGWVENKQTNKSPLFIDTNSVKDGLAEPQGSTSSPSHCRPFALRDSQAISEPQFTV